MNVAGINYESINDGEGVRTVIYVSGCSHRCPNCHNPQTHDINYGIEFTNELQNEIIDNIKKRPFISGVTLSGGDPLHNNNVFDVLNFIKKIKDNFSNKSIWLYTGYTWEQLIDKFIEYKFTPFAPDADEWLTRYEIIESVNVVVDGRYIDKQRDIALKWRGSQNQRIIDVKKTLKENKIILYN